MTIISTKQTRIFVPSTEPSDWADTLIGRVIRQLAVEFEKDLRWYWFSRYGVLITTPVSPQEDRGDCDFDKIPVECKKPLNSGSVPMHRSVRFRFKIRKGSLPAFEKRLRDLLAKYRYAISDVRPYHHFAEMGGERFLAKESSVDLKARANQVVEVLHAVSKLTINCLIGPDASDRYRSEVNGHQENPNQSTFESVHHLFGNITNVPLSVLLKPLPLGIDVRTYWGSGYNSKVHGTGASQVTEIFVPY